MVVVVTPTFKVAVCALPPLTVRAHCPGPCGVTVKVVALLPELGENVAIPLHEFVGSLTVKFPP